MQKEVERMFGVSKWMFEILRQKFYEFYLENIVLMLDTCVLLHKMIIRMQQNGDFHGEAADADVVTESCDVEQATAHESRSELHQTVSRMNSYTMDDSEEEAESLMLTQMEYTIHIAFCGL